VTRWLFVVVLCICAVSNVSALKPTFTTALFGMVCAAPPQLALAAGMIPNFETPTAPAAIFADVTDRSASEGLG